MHLLYVNDLHRCTSVLDFHLFADDPTFFLQDQNLSLKYRQDNFLTFHPQQGKVLSDNVKISGVHVEQTTSVKYLVLFISCH